MNQFCGLEWFRSPHFLRFVQKLVVFRQYMRFPIDFAILRVAFAGLKVFKNFFIHFGTSAKCSAQISQKITAKIGIKGYPGQVGGSTLGVLTPVFLATNVGGVRMKKPKFGNFGIRTADLVPYPPPPPLLYCSNNYLLFVIIHTCSIGKPKETPYPLKVLNQGS